MSLLLTRNISREFYQSWSIRTTIVKPLSANYPFLPALSKPYSSLNTINTSHLSNLPNSALPIGQLFINDDPGNVIQRDTILMDDDNFISNANREMNTRLQEITEKIFAVDDLSDSVTTEVGTPEYDVTNQVIDILANKPLVCLSYVDDPNLPIPHLNYNVEQYSYLESLGGADLIHGDHSRNDRFVSADILDATESTRYIMHDN